jgi:hypothetical protein
MLRSEIGSHLQLLGHLPSQQNLYTTNLHPMETFLNNGKAFGTTIDCQLVAVQDALASSVLFASRLQPLYLLCASCRSAGRQQVQFDWECDSVLGAKLVDVNPILVCHVG